MASVNNTDNTDNADPNAHMAGHTEENSTKSNGQLEKLPAPTNGEGQDGGQEQFPTGLKLYAIVLGLVLAVLCSGLDRSIIGVATPKITAEFNSLDDVAWYGSAYLMMSSCSQLIIGKLYAQYNVKYIYMATLAVFEVGSILCAAAPNSACLIMGRAVAGLGSTGITTGSMLIIAYSLPLHLRPKYTSMIGAGLFLSVMLAPFIGGALTDKASWRWCFWINLPMGVVTIVVVFFLVHLPERPKTAEARKSWRAFLRELDYVGTVLITPCMICLLLALQWGGTAYPWRSWRCILLLTLFGLSAVLFVVLEYRLGDRSTLPPRIVRQRSMLAIMWFGFFGYAVLMLSTYFVPIWFQAVGNVSAYQAGINLLANSVPMLVFFVVTGFLTSATGYYVPQLILGALLNAATSGMMVRFGVHTSTVYWAAALVLGGISFGLSGAQATMVAQTVFRDSDIALATSVVNFIQTLSSSVFLFVCQNVFQQRLVSELQARAPSADPAVVMAHGASGLVAAMRELYPEDVVEAILEAYAQALRRIWIVGAVLACVGIPGALSVEWISVKKDKNKKEEENVGDSKTGADGEKLAEEGR